MPSILLPGRPRPRAIRRDPSCLLPFAAFLALALCVAMAGVAADAWAITLPTGFVSEDAAPGAGFIVPVTFTFMPDGRMLVGEKEGRVWVVKNGVKLPTPMWQSQNEVLDETDRGMLDVAVDPNYVTNHFVYFLYTVDPDSDGVDTTEPGWGRLVRYRTSVADSNVVDPATRTILLGTGWRTGPIIGSPSHTIGSLRWGADGSLLVSNGDGAEFNTVDAGGIDPQMFGPQEANPYEDIGAFRSQNLWSLNGKILRINPLDGHGYPSNPFWDGSATSVRSRVWVYGLRNPFRFNVRPGTGSSNVTAGNPGTLYIGDVGWATWEEMNVARTGGKNFGWPCYEGEGVQFTYESANPSHGGCDSTGVYWNPAAVTPPLATWNHTDAGAGNPPGFIGNASVGGSFYTGTFYPNAYKGRYFHADYGENWIKVAVVDSLDNLITLLPFASDAEGPVCVRADPASGDLYYVSIFSFEVRRIRYTGGGGGNSPPIAVANGSPTAGVPPLAVTFSSAGTFDLDSDTLSYQWTFGDGQGSTLPNPPHTYTTFGIFDAILSVDDGHGGIGRDTVRVSAIAGAAFPATGILDDFNRPNGGLGGAWGASPTGLSINSNALVSNGSYASTVFEPGVFGALQEAYYTVTQVTPNAYEHDVLLKVQGEDPSDGHIEVKWDGTEGAVLVSTFDPNGGWTTQGGPYPLVLQSGDQFGARAHPDGRVEVFVNTTLLATADCSSWPYYSLGGRLGMTFYTASSSRIDNFGGGTVVLNTPPLATILSPVDSTFYAAGDTLRAIGQKSDGEDAPGALAGHWSLRLIHNNHFHIEAEVNGDTASTLALDHDDGTGVYYEFRYYVTDTGSLADTAIVRVFPEADLEPDSVHVSPATPNTTHPAFYRFWIRNHGRLPAHRSRWRLMAGPNMLAEGDTLVAALDSVLVERWVAPGLAAGTYNLRVVVDTLHTVVETNESNNAKTRTLVVNPGSVAVGDPALPRELALSNAFPNPTVGRMSLTLSLPRESEVRLAIHDLQGRTVWSEGPRTFEAGITRLEWSGRSAAGGRVAPGLYLARVTALGRTFTRRFAVLD